MDNIIMIILGVGLILAISGIWELKSDVARMRVLIEEIAKEVGVPALTDPVIQEVRDLVLKDLVAQGKKIDAIKRYRELTGLGLKEAKEYVDKLSEEHRIS